MRLAGHIAPPLANRFLAPITDPYPAPVGSSSSRYTITFVDGQAVAGDRVELISDGTSWFAYAFSKVQAGITFTQASA